MFFFKLHSVYGSPDPLHCSCDSHDTVREVCQWNTEKNWRRGGEKSVFNYFPPFYINGGLYSTFQTVGALWTLKPMMLVLLFISKWFFCPLLCINIFQYVIKKQWIVKYYNFTDKNTYILLLLIYFQFLTLQFVMSADICFFPWWKQRKRANACLR